MITTGGTVGLAEGIIDDTCLVNIRFLELRRQNISKKTEIAATEVVTFARKIDTSNSLPHNPMSIASHFVSQSLANEYLASAWMPCVTSHVSDAN